MSSPQEAPSEVDVAVVGAGIVGLATARELHVRRPEHSLAVLDAADRLGSGQTGANSGVIHAGIYYTPGSLKARLCVAGARALYDYCDRHAIGYKRSGKLIVARSERELARLDELERRGRSNGVPGLRRIDAAGILEIEPHARGLAALHSPATGVVDFGEVARSLAAGLAEEGVRISHGCRVTQVEERGSRSGRSGRLLVHHARGSTAARFAVFCAGTSADRLAVLAGAPPEPRIVPFRGAYLHLKTEREGLVRSMIYPVPDPSLPFLGAHLTRHVDGRVSLGPSALLWPRDARDVAFPGTWRLARRFWRTGARELRHALDRRAFARAASDYVPELTPSAFERGFAGVRAQAVARDGRLVDDFVVSRTARALHVRNAPSPAATSSLALAELIADRVGEAEGR